MDARETTFYYAVLIAAISIGCILGWFLFSIIRLHRRYLRWHKSSNEAQVMLIEKERARIAADLHDELGPFLSATKFKLTGVEPQSPDEEELLQQASDHIDTMVGRIRQLSNGLMPNTLLRKGAVSAIEELIYSMAQSFPVKIEFLPYAIPALSQDQSINIYRIVQEMIHNTQKHASASRVKIQFFVRTGQLVIIYTDDGIGFNPASVVKEKNGLGLRNLLSRTEMLGGNMFLNTKPGKGTEIIIEIPLNYTQDDKQDH